MRSTYVGADIGKACVKISYRDGDGGQLVNFLAENKIARSRGTESIGGNSYGPISISVNGNQYVFGGIQKSPLNTDNYQMSELKLASLIASLKKADIPPGEVVLGLAVPYELYYNHEAKADHAYIKTYSNYYTVNINGYNITEVYAVPEAVSSFTAYLKEYKPANLGVYVFLDIGGSSVERIVFYKTKDSIQILFDTSNNSLMLGTSFPLENLQRQAAMLTKQRIADPKILGDLLLSPTFVYNGVEYDCTKEREEVLNVYSEQLYNFLTDNFADEIKTCNVVIGGGGSILIKDYLKKWCHHSVYQNVHATSISALNLVTRKKAAKHA